LRNYAGDALKLLADTVTVLCVQEEGLEALSELASSISAAL